MGLGQLFMGIGSVGFGFAGFFAQGGKIPTGQMGIVGENGPEFAFSTGEGTVISPFAQARAALSGAAPATPMSVDNDMVGSASDTIYNSSSVSNAYAANRSSINNCKISNNTNSTTTQIAEQRK